jgi:N-acyl-D-aspartate/D-glutamate deacylase
MVRDRAVLTLEEAIRRMTSLPAGRAGLADRGVVRVGARADLAVFDPGGFRATATFEDPNRLAEGMRHVVVNGVVQLRDGVPTGDRAGRALHA